MTSQELKTQNYYRCNNIHITIRNLDLTVTPNGYGKMGMLPFSQRVMIFQNLMETNQN